MSFPENKNNFLFLLTFIMNVVNDMVETRIRQDVDLFQSVWSHAEGANHAVVRELRQERGRFIAMQLHRLQTTF